MAFRFVTAAVMLAWAGNAVSPAVLREAAPPRVLVMPFAVDVDADAPGGASAALWLGEAAAVLITDGLAARGLTPLARGERLAAFDRLNLPMSSVLTRATMIRVGELVGASAVVFGDVRLDGRLSVRARLVDLVTGAEGAAVADDAEVADLFSLFDRLSDRLATGLAMPPSPPAASTVVWSLEAFENYIKGLVAAAPEAQQRFLEAAMVQAPLEGRVLLELWRVYSTLGLYDKALEAASAVPASSDLARQARLAVALSLIELGRLDGATRELSTLHEQRPSATLANALGVVGLRRADEVSVAASRAFFEEAVRLEPGRADYWFNLGYAQARAGRTDEALAALREVARLEVADASAHVLMSALLAGAGRTAEAHRERELAAWLGALPDAETVVLRVVEGLERLPQALVVDGPPESGALGVGSFHGDEAATAAYYLERGTKLIEARRDREAIAELGRAVYLDPYADEPHLLLGLVYQRNGRLTEAIDEFRVALWSRETAEGHIALGRVLLDTGDREAARRAAERALALDPQSVEARELLDRIGG